MKLVTRVLLLILFFVPSIILAQVPSSCCPQTPTKEKQQALWQKLQDRIGEVDRHLDGVMGVAIRDLTSGDTYLLHGDDVFAQASSIKITVLAELYEQEQRGRHGEKNVARLNDLYTVRSEDMVPDSFIMLGLTPGVTRPTCSSITSAWVMSSRWWGTLG
jgi:beta-lactamase class A